MTPRPATRSGRVRARARDGFALLASLLLVLLLALLAAALLSVGTQQRRSARLHGGALRARSAAEAGVRIAAAAWDTALDTLAAGATAAVPGAAGTWPDGSARSVAVERLAGGGFLITGRGTALDAAAARAVARLVVADPRRMWADFPAAITTGGAFDVLPGAIVDGSAGPPPPGWGAADCPPDALAERSAALGPGDLPAILADSAAALAIDPAASLFGAPPIARAPLASAPRVFDGLGALRSADLAMLADHRPVTPLAPAPVTANGACDTASIANWGDPFDPSTPCGDFRPLIHAAGDLHLTGGSGQGLLVVDGDLTITGPFEFRGGILVKGRLDAPAATVHGALRVGSRTTASSFGGHVRHDGCALWRALHSAALRRPFRTDGRWWIPAF